MEFSALATKRLNSYAFLPSKKSKKYTEAHALFVKAADCYLSQTQSANVTQERRLSLYSSAGESWASAASLAVRKLGQPRLSASANIESALAYELAEEFELAHEALKRGINARELLRSSSTSASPPPLTLTAPAPSLNASNTINSAKLSVAHTDRKQFRRSRRGSDVGPRTERKPSRSMPPSPVLVARSSPSIADLTSLTTPSSPRLENAALNSKETAKKSGMLSKMKNLMVRTDKKKEATTGASYNSNGRECKANGEKEKSEPESDLSPRPYLPVAIVPASPLPPSSTVSATHSSTDSKSQPHSRHMSLVAPNALLPVAHTVDESPPSHSPPLMLGDRLNPGHVPLSDKNLVSATFSLLLAEFALSLASKLWNELLYKSSIDTLEIALRLLTVLDDTNTANISTQLLNLGHFLRLYSTITAVNYYLSYHTFVKSELPLYDYDPLVLIRVKDLCIDAVKYCNARRDGDGDVSSADVAEWKLLFSDRYRTHTHTVVTTNESDLYYNLCFSLDSLSFPSRTSLLFTAGLCDALAQTKLTGFHDRVLFTPPLLIAASSLHQKFNATRECKFLRQCYGLLQLSLSAPARLADNGGYTQEDQYRRVLLTIWGNEIMTEFIAVLIRFVNGKKGKDLNAFVVSENKVHYDSSGRPQHPLVSLIGHQPDASESLDYSDLDGVDEHAVQLILRVKKTIRQLTTAPSLREKTAAASAHTHAAS